MRLCLNPNTHSELFRSDFNEIASEPILFVVRSNILTASYFGLILMKLRLNQYCLSSQYTHSELFWSDFNEIASEPILFVVRSNILTANYFGLILMRLCLNPYCLSTELGFLLLARYDQHMIIYLNFKFNRSFLISKKHKNSRKWLTRSERNCVSW